MIDREALSRLVPQKDRMFLLDRVRDYSVADLWLEAEVDISDGSLFLDPQTRAVPVWVAFEYMAQSIAALSGIVNFEADGSPPKIGFIMGVRDFECSCANFGVGSRLTIHVSQIFRDGSVVSFQCRVSTGNSQLVNTIINAIEVDDQGVQSMAGAASA